MRQRTGAAYLHEICAVQRSAAHFRATRRRMVGRALAARVAVQPLQIGVVNGVRIVV